MFFWSGGEATNSLRRLRFRLMVVFLVRICLLYAWVRSTLPVPVTLNLFLMNCVSSALAFALPPRSMLLVLFGLIFWCKIRDHAAAFDSRFTVNLPESFAGRDKLLQHVKATVCIGYFPSSKLKHNLDLIAILQNNRQDERYFRGSKFSVHLVDFLDFVTF